MDGRQEDVDFKDFEDSEIEPEMEQISAFEDFEDSEIEPEIEKISDFEDQISDYENESDYLPSDLEDLGFYEE